MFDVGSGGEEERVPHFGRIGTASLSVGGKLVVCVLEALLGRWLQSDREAFGWNEESSDGDRMAKIWPVEMVDDSLVAK